MNPLSGTNPSVAERASAFRRVTDNAVSMFALQGLTYAISFLTLPYLVRTLGTSGFGSVSFVNSVMAQLTILTGFGFVSSATRLVAIQARKGASVAEQDNSQLNGVFSAVMSVKLLLLALAFAITLVLVLCFSRFREKSALLAVAFIQVVGSVLFPDWLFLGLERMRLAAGISILARLSSAACILVFVHGKSDEIKAVACQSAGVFLQGFVAVWVVFFVFKIRIERTNLKAMWEQTKDSFHPFLSASFGNLLGGSSVMFLGLFKDINTVGSYAAIERIARAEVLAMVPASRAAYPHMSQRFHESLQAGNRAMVKLSACVLGGALMFVGLIALFSKPILRLLYGNRLLEQAHLFSSFSVWSFLSLLNGLLGQHYLIASGNAKAFAKSVLYSAVITVFLFLLLIGHLGGWGALGAVVIGELVQTGIIISAMISINRMQITDAEKFDS